MFIKTAGFKKILKEAYKGGGLHIGATSDTVYVAGSYWAIEVLRKEIPKEKLAAIIELVGALPLPGEQYLADKYGQQMELSEIKSYKPMRAMRADDAMVMVEFTPVVLSLNEGKLRVLQNYSDGSITLINDIFMSILSDSDVKDQEGHTPMDGPYLEMEKYGNIYLRNNVMAMCIAPVKLGGERMDLVKYLEGIIINGEQDSGKSDVSKENGEEEEEEA